MRKLYSFHATNKKKQRDAFRTQIEQTKPFHSEKVIIERSKYGITHVTKSGS
jgi:hypothetical protein